MIGYSEEQGAQAGPWSVMSSSAGYIDPVLEKTNLLPTCPLAQLGIW